MEAHHVPELVKGHDEARAHSSQPLEGSDVNFDPDPFLHAAVQLPQRAAFRYWGGEKTSVNNRSLSRTSGSWSRQNLQGILVRMFFWGFCFRLRGVALLWPSSATGFRIIRFFSRSMRSGSGTPFLALRCLRSRVSGLARPLPPRRKPSYSATLLKHRTFGKGTDTVGAYRAARGSNLSEHTSILAASSSPGSVSVPAPGCGTAGVSAPALDCGSVLPAAALRLSPSSMFQNHCQGSRDHVGLITEQMLLSIFVVVDDSPVVTFCSGNYIFTILFIFDMKKKF